MLLNIILTVSTIIILSFIWKIFYPLLFALYYKIRFGKDVAICFYPFGGFYHYLRKSTKESGDCWLWLRNMIKQNPHAKIIVGKFLIRPSILIVDYNLAKEFMTEKEHFYKKPDVMYRIDLFLEQGLLFSYGKQWKRQRQLLQHVFHFDSLKSYVPLMHQVIQEKLVTLREQADTGIPIFAQREMQKITGEIVIRAFFGDQYSHLIDNYSFSSNINDTFRDITTIHRDPVYTLKRMILGTRGAQKYFKTKMEKQCYDKIKLLREMALKVIDDRMKTFEQNECGPKDFLDIHIKAWHESKNKSNDVDLMTKEEIIHQFITFYFAGQETTATFISMILIMLPRHPEMYKKVQQEIDELYDDPTKLTHVDLKKMKYTQCFMDEVLRVYAPASDLTARLVTKNHKIGKFPAYKDTAVNINLNSILRDERNFEQPDKIIPERWMEDKIKEKYSYFVPFSLGPRNCIGQHMAKIETGIIIIYILKQFRLEQNTEKDLIMQVTPLYQPKHDDLIKLYSKK